MPDKVIQDLLGISVLDGASEGIFGIHDYHTNRYELMQFSGLKDRNGVEIYEGDIVHFESTLNIGKGNLIVVKWQPDYARWDFGPLHAIDMQDTKIIGNIYENPELVS